MLFSLIGGLGIFLYGMKSMSSGLQAVAGNTLRRLIASVTDNRVMAVGVGTLVTCLVQSSSITTVMVVGFVNSGIMLLTQAMGVILGANIGTTITGWILVLKIGKYGLPILGVGVFFHLFSKNEKVKHIALTIFGLGMIFFGLALMKNGFKPLRGLPEFKSWFLSFDAGTYFGVLKAAAVGCALTLIVQSSSATLGITIGLAQTGLIDFQTAAALVLGENIGTTITAYLASFGTTPNAKRAAYFHVLLNLVGVFIITSIFRLYLPFIHWTLAAFSGIEDISQRLVKDGVESYPHITAGIAAVHTVFNVANTLLFLPFLPRIAGVLNRMVPEASSAQKKRLPHLDYKLFQSPFAAVEQSRFEIEKLSLQTQRMFGALETYLAGGKDRKKAAEAIFQGEDNIDHVQKELTEFLTSIKGHQLSFELNMECTRYLLIADEYESISDYLMAILKLHMRLEEHDLAFSASQKKAVQDIHEEVKAFYAQATEFAQQEDWQAFHQAILARRDAITKKVKASRRAHWEAIQTETYNPLLGTTFTDLLVAYRKISNHLLQIVEAYADE